VGIDVNARTEDVAWPKCSKCGRKDTEGEMLVKKRKVVTCIGCGRRQRGVDNNNRHTTKINQSTAFQTPTGSRQAHGTILRKQFNSQKEAFGAEALSVEE
jgi:hypothetical protein